MTPTPHTPPPATSGSRLTDEQLARPHCSPVLIRGAAVLTMDPRLGDLDRGDVLVHGDTITAVGPDLSARAGDCTVIDATGTVAVPGFVDSHLHAWEGQLRGLDPVVDFGGYLGLTAFGHGPRYRPEDVYAGTLATALSCLHGGITTVVDNAHNALTPEHARSGVQALLDVGIRGVAAIGAPFGADLDHIGPTALALRERHAGPLLDVRLFEVHPSVDRWRFAAAADLWVSTELGPHTPGLDSLLTELDDAGLMTGMHAFNHCYDLSPQAWRLIGGSGAAVNLCPRSDAAFGLGTAVPPVEAALRHPAAIGLSNDNEISYRLDMFAEMQALLSRSRAEAFRQVATGGEGHPDLLSARRLLEFATLGGAANAGLADRIGSLSPGKQADVVLVRTDTATTFPVTDPVTVVTAFATPADVDTVLVAGRLRKRHGRLVGVDAAGARELIGASRRRLTARQDEESDLRPVLA